MAAIKASLSTGLPRNSSTSGLKWTFTLSIDEITNGPKRTQVEENRNLGSTLIQGAAGEFGRGERI